MEFSNKDKIEIIENAISWIVVFAMFVYGSAKIIQFNETSLINEKVSDLTGMQLMWAFYGYSKSYAITLGIFEIIGGLLILIKKTRIIGCLFTSTILVNVIFQDIYFNVHYGALRAAFLYQALIIIVLWLNREALFKSIKTLLNFKNIQQTKMKMIIKIFIAILIFAALRILEYYMTIRW